MRNILMRRLAGNMATVCDGHKRGPCYQRHGATAAVLLWLKLAAMDVVPTHASAKRPDPEAAKPAGGTAAGAELTKRTRIWDDVPDHAALHDVKWRRAGSWASRRCGL